MVEQPSSVPMLSIGHLIRSPWIIQRIFLRALSSISSSVLVRHQISAPYSILWRAMEEYSHRAVMEWRHPNLSQHGWGQKRGPSQVDVSQGPVECGGVVDLRIPRYKYSFTTSGISALTWRIKSLRVLSALQCFVLILRALNARVQSRWRRASLFTIDKLMTGSSFEGKAFFKKPQNSEL